MSEADGASRPRGPKTLLRSGVLLSPCGERGGDGAAEAPSDRGAAARRALIEEIRAQAVRPAGKKRRCRAARGGSGLPPVQLPV